jgi:hypothetical protein
MEIPEEKLDLSRLSIYAGKMGKTVTNFQKDCPLIYSGTWKSDDNQIGIALASISDDAMNIKFNIDTDDYGLATSGKLNFIDEDGTKFMQVYKDGKIEVDFTLQPKQLCIIELISNQ